MILSGGWRLAARMRIEFFQKFRNTSWSAAWLLGICPQSWSSQLLPELVHPKSLLTYTSFSSPSVTLASLVMPLCVFPE